MEARHVTNARESTSHCDTCLASGSCATLATVMAIVEKHRDDIQDAEFLACYDRIMTKLSEANWCYPVATAICRLGGDSSELDGMINELIKRWRWVSTQTARVPGACTSLEEEGHQD